MVGKQGAGREFQEWGSERERTGSVAHCIDLCDRNSTGTLTEYDTCSVPKPYDCGRKPRWETFGKIFHNNMDMGQFHGLLMLHFQGFEPHCLNPFASGILKVFAVPHNGIIFSENSVKIYNQINASFIDISRIKWLVFLLWSSFFRTTSTVASSEAPADYQPAPGRTDGIPERHQRQWIIKTVFINLCQELVVDKGIRQKSIHSIPFRSLIPWQQCLLSGGTEACSLGLRETPACIHVIQRLSQPRVACWHGFRPNSQKTECVFYTLSDMRSEKKLRVYTASEAKGLMP